jgi:hypothetical protein
VTVAFALSLFFDVRDLSAQEVVDDLPRRTMSDAMYTTLRQAIESSPITDGRKKVNLNALDHLRGVRWPDLSKLERVHLYSPENKDRFVNMWRSPGDRDEMLVLTPEYRVSRLPKNRFSKIEVFEYEEELRELLRLARAADAEKKGETSLVAADFMDGKPWPHWGGVYHACAAALLGNHEVATVLVHHSLKYGNYFPQIYDNWAWAAFYPGIELLENGSPHTQVLRLWENCLETYPHSQYREQLLNYTSTLKRQIDEDQKAAAPEVLDPEHLLINDRIEYFIKRFPDVHGRQDSQPGHCTTVSGFPPRRGTGTWLSDSIVEIGWPAIPKLVEHLTDRRLTRSVGFHRNFDRHRTVLRVQDVAVQCVEKITGIHFYNPSSTGSYLSNEQPEVREAVIKSIRTWWDENAQKGLVAVYLARLDQGAVWERVKVLQRIEQHDKKAIDSIAVLKRWADSAAERDMPTIARELAKRSDRSLLPLMRQLMKGADKQTAAEAVWCLLKWGDVDDYCFVRRTMKEEVQAGVQPAQSPLANAVRAEMKDSNNPLAVPLLVEFLRRREPKGQWSDARQYHTWADDCIPALVRITGYDSGYRPNDPPEGRFESFNRWLAWWEDEGKAAFVEAHPEVNNVLRAGEQ